jgi:ADP-ribose pyrophosphatase YjhB (NUDIX family)
MSRKARQDRALWNTPTIYAFAGDYGPFKFRGDSPIEDALVVLTVTKRDDKEGVLRHPVYRMAGEAQHLLLTEKIRNFKNIIVVDLGDMICEESTLSDTLAKEAVETELVKGFGKTLLRLMLRLRLHRVVLLSQGELCAILLKLLSALVAHDPGIIADAWLLHPILTAQYINTHLVPMGQLEQKRHVTSSEQSGNGVKKQGQPKKASNRQNQQKHRLKLHLVFESIAARDKRLDAIRFAYPHGTTQVVDIDKKHLLCVLFGNLESQQAPSGTTVSYDPEYCNTLGKSLFLSKLSVDMSVHTKQYERNCEEITADLLMVKMIEANNRRGCDDQILIENLTQIDWSTCEHHFGALVLRGNRCVLVRSLNGAWKGMRLPSVAPKPDELPTDAAIRALVEFTGVEATEVTVLSFIPPVALYAPNERPIFVHLYPLYATEPPPDGPLEDADLEDDETPYDWYTFDNAIRQLDERSNVALHTMVSALIEAANVGVLPCKWGGVFGQELIRSLSNGCVCPLAGNLAPKLMVQTEEWKPSRQNDVFQDVRKASADLLQRLANRKISAGKSSFKLPVTLLSG